MKTKNKKTILVYCEIQKAWKVVWSNGFVDYVDDLETAKKIAGVINDKNK